MHYIKKLYENELKYLNYNKMDFVKKSRFLKYIKFKNRKKEKLAFGM